ncbi:sensor histidine kinase [Kitasatospora sp. NPDC096204]|uniref:sensor histidine kinase n=1 Tax=Kitasatospora sp. NPDC096204 TaxID=3364094 RepID=UPI0037F591E9
MPGIPARRTGHRAGRSGSLRGSLLSLALVPSLGLAAAWGYAVHLLRDSGQRTALLAGSAAVAAVVLISLFRGVRTAWRLSARLSDLRADTVALARQEIPEVVERLRAGEQVAAPTAWAPSRRGGDDLQQASEGLAAARQAAVAAIIHQAQGREGTKKVFLNIARRTQILIHRQISMLDALEREYEDPELLRELFAVDHLATRMRRNAENLVILGGALPARRWRTAVPVVNVLRSAVSETESYSRVVVQGVPRVSLDGQAVADVIHLVAELIENGTTFSPPYTQVQVSAQEVPTGLAVEVEDRGLGMTEEEYRRLNDYLADPPELDVSALGDDLRLGLFVVARLAARHDVRVSLRPSPYGGTRAVVLVPSALLERAGQLPQSAAVPGLPSGARITRAPASDGRPATGGGSAGGGSAGGDSAGGGFGTGAGPGVGSGVGSGSGWGSASGSGSGAGTGSGAGSGHDGAGRDPSGVTAVGTGGRPDGGQGAPGPFGAPGAPAVPYATDGNGSGAVDVVRADAPDNGGLPAGAEIPGLPGAVVVPRPVPPRMYDLSSSPTVGHGATTPVHGALPTPSVPPRAPGEAPAVRESEDPR